MSETPVDSTISGSRARQRIAPLGDDDDDRAMDVDLGPPARSGRGVHCFRSPTSFFSASSKTVTGAACLAQPCVRVAKNVELPLGV